MSVSASRSDSSTLKRLALEAEAAPTLPSRGLCFAQHLLHLLQTQYAVACQDLLRAAATAPMHGTAPAREGSEQLLQPVSSPVTGRGQESQLERGRSSALMPCPRLRFPVWLLHLPSVPLTRGPVAAGPGRRPGAAVATAVTSGVCLQEPSQPCGDACSRCRRWPPPCGQQNWRRAGRSSSPVS